MVSVKIDGLAQVLKNLEELPIKVRQYPLRRAVGKGAAVIKKHAKANALKIDDPNTGRRIADNIGQRVRTRETRRTGNVTVSVGVLSKHGKIPEKPSNPDEGHRGNTPHWHLIELGTPSRNIRPQPFLRDAAQQSTSEVFNAVASALPAEIDKEVAKMRKK
ncbi:hypothetical protein CEQ07_05200 [Oligella urethralis]|uniref:HK97-gp10 family putative phage morphogenesis protein n=1 Tax=Oligella urethralis TaxID=90245 RepID=UPI000CFECCC3|nr:HK97-gp10 family putative phage morphogenesis protein [Oligella urethralis]AVL70865.1 hypothetical protein CEQ07_05200 [Oligella urethralis]